MSAPLPVRERGLRSLVVLVLSIFVILLGVGLIEAHCADVVKPAAIYLSLSAADLGTTAWAESHGAVEGNPFMRSDRIGKQVALAALFTLADASLRKRGAKRGLRIAVAAVRVGAIFINVRHARRRQ